MDSGAQPPPYEMNEYHEATGGSFVHSNAGGSSVNKRTSGKYDARKPSHDDGKRIDSSNNKEKGKKGGIPIFSPLRRIFAGLLNTFFTGTSKLLDVTAWIPFFLSLLVVLFFIIVYILAVIVAVTVAVINISMFVANTLVEESGS